MSGKRRRQGHALRRCVINHEQKNDERGRGLILWARGGCMR